MSSESYFRPTTFNGVATGVQQPASDISSSAFNGDTSFGQYKSPSFLQSNNNYNNSGSSNSSGIDTLGAINSGASILRTLGGLWSAHEQNKMAKQEFNFNKDVFNKQWTAYQEDRQRKHDFEDSVGDQYDRVNHTGKYAKDTTKTPVTTQQAQSKERGTASPVTSLNNQKTKEVQYTRPKNQNVLKG